jgi:predicted dithiol-disulfide oxidoreductase (DUF899 family)
MQNHDIVTREEWTARRKALLAKEKEFTRLRDRLGEERRRLPWVRVEENYVFDTAGGRKSLAELFEGRSQLVVYHFMFDPGWETPCKSCSFWADNFERNVVHLAARDVTLIAVSRAPLAKIEAFRRRMGWTFNWVSSAGNRFNFDYHVSFDPNDPAHARATYNYAKKTSTMTELPGISVFCKDAQGTVFHTYSCYARGLDMMNAAYHYLDLVPKGRDEAGQTPHAMAWVRYRDSYGR